MISLFELHILINLTVLLESLLVSKLLPSLNTSYIKILYISLATIFATNSSHQGPFLPSSQYTYKHHGPCFWHKQNWKREMILCLHYCYHYKQNIYFCIIMWITTFDTFDSIEFLVCKTVRYIFLRISGYKIYQRVKHLVCLFFKVYMKCNFLDSDYCFIRKNLCNDRLGDWQFSSCLFLFSRYQVFIYILDNCVFKKGTLFCVM